MGRAIGSKKKSASIKVRRENPACPHCGHAIQKTQLGYRCSWCRSLYAPSQKVDANFQPDSFKVKTLNYGEHNASGKGAFRVIEYVE
jgi:Zn finger protein HypA/HybF involved in hydrogenase expression